MIDLRTAKESDLSIIADLAKQIWPNTYSAYLSDEQIAYMLGKMYNPAELLTQLKNGHTFLIVAELGRDVGFAGFSVINASLSIYKLHKLYVLPKMQGKGIGKILINDVVKRVKHTGGKLLQLNVNRNNKAMNFYESIGFTIKATVDVDIGHGFYMNDYVMEKEL